jgi:deoxyribonuclease V
MSFDRFTKTGTAAVVVLSYPEMMLEEVETMTGRAEFPYVPGLLSFREAPLALAAFEKLRITPDLVIIDGQGYAHPRRMGIACHIGLFLDIPTIGCAKSRLCGVHGEPGKEAGSISDLTDNDEIIGRVIRTKSDVKPLYISVGHKISLENAAHWVSACCRGYRLPEPSRLAHLAAGGNLRTPVPTS